MLEIIGITFPVFGLIALGYAVVWKGLFSQDDLKVFGKYVLNIALPALLFSALARNPISEVFQPEYIAIYGIASLGSMGLSYLWFTLRPTGPARRAIAVMGAGCPNSGYLGLPILMLAFPNVAASAISMNLIVENLVMVPLSLLLLDLSRPRDGQSMAKLLGGIFLGILKRPMIIGMILGMLTSIFGGHLPVPFERLTTLLAGSTAPIALMVIGGSLVGLPLQGNLSMALQIVVTKLILHPALAALTIMAWAALGLSGMDPTLAAALIVSASMPMLGIYAILAQDYGHAGMASMAMLGSVVFGFFTSSALLFLLL